MIKIEQFKDYKEEVDHVHKELITRIEVNYEKDYNYTQTVSMYQGPGNDDEVQKVLLNKASIAALKGYLEELEKALLEAGLTKVEATEIVKNTLFAI